MFSEIPLRPALRLAASSGLSAGHPSAEPGQSGSIPRQGHVQTLQGTFQAGVLYRTAHPHPYPPVIESAPVILPQLKSALSFSSCPASGRTKSGHNTAHAAQIPFPFYFPTFAYGNFIILLYQLHS